MADLSVLHAPALGCLTISYLTAAHLLLGTVHVELDSGSRLVNAFCSDETCVAFTLLVGAAATAGFFLCRAGRRKDGRMYWWGSGVLSGLSVVLALAVGFFSPALNSAWATPVVIVNAAALFVAAALLRSWALSWTGSVLFLLALVHALTFNEPLLAVLGRTSLVPDQPVLVAVLLHAGVVFVMVCRPQLRPELGNKKLTTVRGPDRLEAYPTDPAITLAVCLLRFPVPIRPSAANRSRMCQSPPCVDSLPTARSSCPADRRPCGKWDRDWAATT